MLNFRLFARYSALFLLGFSGIAFGKSTDDAESDVKVLTTDNFDQTIKDTEIILVEFYAPWCGHCKALAPEYEKAATELKDEPVVIAKVDCTENQEVCNGQGVQGYPTLKLFRNGTPVDYNKARQADAIVAFMKNQLLPAITELKSDSFKEFTEKHKVVVVGFFKSSASAKYEMFTKVAEKLREDYVFGAVFDKDLADKQKSKVPGIILYKKFDEKKNVFPENVDPALVKQGDDDKLFTEDVISKFIQVNSVPLVNDVGPENYGKYMDSGLPLAFLFVESDDDRTKFGPMVEAAAKKHRGKINFVFIDAGKFGGHASNLNLKEEWPAFAIQDIVGGSKFPYPQDKKITKDDLLKFCNEFAEGKLKPSIKSAPIPEDNSGPVKVVVADNFEEIVLDKSKDVFVEFYAPWCGHCKRLAPIWEELGEKLESADHIVIAKMDATENDIPPGQSFQIEGFPTLKLFKAETNEIVDYPGDRSLASMVEFLKENSSKSFNVDISSSEDSDEVEHDEL